MAYGMKTKKRSMKKNNGMRKTGMTAKRKSKKRKY